MAEPYIVNKHSLKTVIIQHFLILFAEVDSWSRSASTHVVFYRKVFLSGSAPILIICKYVFKVFMFFLPNIGNKVISSCQKVFQKQYDIVFLSKATCEIFQKLRIPKKLMWFFAQPEAAKMKFHYINQMNGELSTCGQYHARWTISRHCTDHVPR